MVQLPEMEFLIPLAKSCRKVLTLSAISSPLKLPTTQRREKRPPILHHEGPAALRLRLWLQPGLLFTASRPGSAKPLRPPPTPAAPTGDAPRAAPEPKGHGGWGVSWEVQFFFNGNHFH